MTDNIFEGLPPPSSQHQELPDSSNPDESKDKSPSPAPTLVQRSKPPESAPDASAPPVLKSALKRSKPAESTPEPEPEAAPKKRLQFKTSTDASEEQVIEAMQKITSHIKNPSKFSKASKLAVRLIQAGSVKAETSCYLIAMLEAAMSSKTPCTDRLVKADYHALFSAAQDVAECLDRSQKNLLTIWTIKAVVANDLFTDDSFMFSKSATQIKEAISDLPIATEEDDAEEAAALEQEAGKDSGEGETTHDLAEAGDQEDVESDPFGLDAWIPSNVKKNGKTKMTKEDTVALENKKFLRSKREALITCLEIAARAWLKQTIMLCSQQLRMSPRSQKNLLTIWTIKAVVANDLFTDDSFMFSKSATQIKEAISDLPIATEEDDAEEAAALEQEAGKDSGEGETTHDLAEAGDQEDVESDPFGLDAWIPSNVKKNGKTKMTKEDTVALENKKFLRSKREALITCLEIAARRYKVPWCQTVIDILVKHAFENASRFTSQQRQAVEKLWASVREQHLRRKQGKSVTGKLDVTAFETLQDKYANEKMSIRRSVGANGERRAQQWLG
ncbi:hypothetical protein F2Q70_00024021 [Brassica cretica]|uniref:Uncharacterized protein n=1 Tax=Brassica cretica TaxID=69181 RepID=A0A8S9GKQ5_BRACR|nr:hypothetical protein F2Q70_00024021 [Brassica cretica]